MTPIVLVHQLRSTSQVGPLRVQEVPPVSCESPTSGPPLMCFKPRERPAGACKMLLLLGFEWQSDMQVASEWGECFTSRSDNLHPHNHRRLRTFGVVPCWASCPHI